MRQQIRQNGGDPDQLGYASIQLDGGIEKVTHKVEAWFEQQLQKEEPDQDENIRLDRLRVGIVNDGPIDARAAGAIGGFVQMDRQRGRYCRRS